MNKSYGLKKRWTIAAITVALIAVLATALCVGLPAHKPAAFPSNSLAGASAALQIENNTITAPTQTAPEGAPADAVGVATGEEFIAFLKGGASYAYFTDDFTLDWGTMGGYSGVAIARLSLAAGRTINGNGHTVTLAPSAGGTVVDVDGTLANSRTVGFLVAENNGTITNLKALYRPTTADASVSLTAKANYSNRIGLLCGTNAGIISKTDLRVDGKLYYNLPYELGNTNAGTAWQTLMGGMTGYQLNTVEDVSVYMTGNARLDATTSARNTGAFGIWTNANARTTVGGVVGRMQSTDTDIAYLGRASFYAENGALLSATANPSSNGTAYREYGLIAGANSAYSGTEKGGGRLNDGLGIIDNVMAYYEAVSQTGIFDSSKLPSDSAWGRNALVHCGQVNNGTIFRKIGAERDGNGVTDTAYTGNGTDHLKGTNCGCANGQEHDRIEPNYVDFGREDIADMTAGFDENGNQVFSVKLKDTVTDKKIIDVFDGDKLVENVLSDSYAFLLDTSEGKRYDRTFGMGRVDGQYDLSAAQASFTGENFIKFVRFLDAEGNVISADPSAVKLIPAAGGDAYDNLIYPGNYAFRPESTETAGWAYIDHVNKIAYPLAQTLELEIIKAALTPGQEIPTGWTQGVSLPFSIENEYVDNTNPDSPVRSFTGINAYLNGSLTPTAIAGTTYADTQDTLVGGRKVSLVGLSGGVEVTEPYEFRIYIDTQAPEIADLTGLPENWQATDAAVRFKAIDALGGIAAVTADGTALTADADGFYAFTATENRAYEIVATDAAGNTVTQTVTPKIDKTVPTLSVGFYVVQDDGTRTDLTAEQLTQNRAIHFTFAATAGPAGVQVYLSENGGEWSLMTGNEAVASKSGTYRFKAVSGSAGVEETLGDVYTVTIDMEKIVVTADNVTVSNADKTYDGTTDFFGTVELVEEYRTVVVPEVTDPETGEVITPETTRQEPTLLTTLKDKISFRVTYADKNAGEGVALRIEVVIDSDRYTADNQIAGLTGAIAKRAITATADNKTKIYGTENPQLTVTVTNAIAADNVAFEATCAATADSAVTEGGYPITVTERADLANYEVTYAAGTLTVTKAVIDRLEYDYGTIYGLIADGTAKDIAVYAVVGGERVRLTVARYVRTDGEAETEVAEVQEAGSYRAYFLLDENNYGLDGIVAHLDFIVAAC